MTRQNADLDVYKRQTRWRILEEIKLTFDEEGIEIPYNQLTVHMKTDEETTKGNGNTLGEN